MLESVGRYRIEDRIGEGAMADVYRAFDPHIARPLAVKVLKSEFLRDRQYADRFLREAKAAGALSHPNIVTIYDVGEAGGTPYIVMELLEGKPLDQLLQNGPLDVTTALQISIQLAEALAFAHSQHVVHRDIKPSNIIVAPDGHSVKLLDFGIARVGDMVFDAESVRTQVGQVLGTPRYMSPEQALGSEIDGRSDLFSVGVVLYEMLSGRRAFQGGSSATLAIQIVQRDPEPLATVAPSTPGGVQFIVSKLLSKQPGLRFADGRQLADAMRKELGALTAAGAEEEVRHSYIPIQVRLPIILALITALLLGAAIWTVLTRQYESMEKVALASGNAISSFVASNAALRAVENATLPSAQQDWAPVEAFVRSASEDPTIRRIVVVGADGVMRASSDLTQVGRPYVAPVSGKVITRRPELTILAQDVANGSGVFRFVRPITYAGRSFGQVDVEVSKATLEAAAQLARILMAALGLVTLGGVALTSYFGARALAAPIRRMKAALLEVARGNLDFRISHQRRDEFGELFDGFNLAASALQERINSIEQLALDAPSAAGGAELAATPEADAAPAIGELAGSDDDARTTIGTVAEHPASHGAEHSLLHDAELAASHVAEHPSADAAEHPDAAVAEAAPFSPSGHPVEALSPVRDNPAHAVEAHQHEYNSLPPETAAEITPAPAAEPEPDMPAEQVEPVSSQPLEHVAPMPLQAVEDHSDRTQMYANLAAIPMTIVDAPAPVAVAPAPVVAPSPVPAAAPAAPPVGVHTKPALPEVDYDDDDNQDTLIGPARR